MKLAPVSSKALSLALLASCGFATSASAVTLVQYKGKTGLAFSNPFTVCGESYQTNSFKSFSFSHPGLRSFSFGRHHAPSWSFGGYSFDCSSYTSPTTGGTLALSGLGIGKPFKKPPTAPVCTDEPKSEPQPQLPPSNGNEKVPDGGSTLLMLGASLLGLHGLVRVTKRRGA